MIQQAKNRMTRQRTIVLEELCKAKTHPTADELYAAVRKRLPKVSLGTVYRNLEYLNRAGSVRRLDSGAGPNRFDGDLSEHCHARCVGCGRIDDVIGGDFDPLDIGTVKTVNGFEIHERKVEFLALCPRCSPAE
jgi:Fur family ferric uptake transcriptional regulator